jgi:hypothetical protein
VTVYNIFYFLLFEANNVKMKIIFHILRFFRCPGSPLQNPVPAEEKPPRGFFSASHHPKNQTRHRHKKNFESEPISKSVSPALLTTQLVPHRIKARMKYFQKIFHPRAEQRRFDLDFCSHLHEKTGAALT